MVRSPGSASIPALLDSALHAVALTAPEGQTALPFSWQGVRLHAAGAAAARARIAPSGPNAMSIELADGLGLPVLSVASMVARPVSTEALHAAMAGGAGRGELFELTWSAAGTPAETPAVTVTDWNDLTDAVELPDGAVVLYRPPTGTGDVVGDTHAATHDALRVLQSWLTRTSPATLLVATRGAIAVAGEDVTDLPAAAVWGLVRAAQTENPGRITLLDTDAADPDAALALAVGEPQVVIRGGVPHTARIVPQPGHAADAAARRRAVAGRHLRGRHVRQPRAGTRAELDGPAGAG